MTRNVVCLDSDFKEAMPLPITRPSTRGRAIAPSKLAAVGYGSTDYHF